MGRKRARTERRRFTAEDEDDMREFFAEKVGRAQQTPPKPFGKKFWEEYAESGRTTRSPSNLCSHFRKQTTEKMDSEGELAQKVSSFKTVNYRKKFTVEEETNMWEFVYEELYKNPLLKPANPKFWDKFITRKDSERTTNSLCSHFRKQMVHRLDDVTLSVDQKNFIKRKLHLSSSDDEAEENENKKETEETDASDEESEDGGTQPEENLHDGDVKENTGSKTTEGDPDENEDDLQLDPDTASDNPVFEDNVITHFPQPSDAQDSAMEVPMEHEPVENPCENDWNEEAGAEDTETVPESRSEATTASANDDLQQPNPALVNPVLDVIVPENPALDVNVPHPTDAQMESIVENQPKEVPEETMEAVDSNIVHQDTTTVTAPQPSDAQDSAVAILFENHAEEVSEEAAEPDPMDCDDPTAVVVESSDVKKEPKDHVVEEAGVKMETDDIPTQAIPPPRSPSPIQLQNHPQSSHGAHHQLTPKKFVEKGVRFFSALVDLTRKPIKGDEDKKKYMQMHKLMTAVIFGSLSADAFDKSMTKVMDKDRNPRILSFLEQALPPLKEAVRKGEAFIDGISPPEGFVYGANTMADGFPVPSRFPT